MLFRQPFLIYGKPRCKEPIIAKEYCRNGQIQRIIRELEERLMD